MKVLDRSFYAREPSVVAKELLGKFLVRNISEGVVVGMIVETEAYLATNDLAAHASRGKTIANSSLFLDGGHAYVHRIHAYHCLDAVCQTKEVGGSVLIRALEPTLGIDIMKKYRGKNDLINLTSGPGKICMSFQIDKSLDGIDLTRKRSTLKICEDSSKQSFTIDTSKRIGISKSKEYDFRFTITGNNFISK